MSLSGRRWQRVRAWYGRRVDEPSHAYLFVGALALGAAAGVGMAFGWRGVLGALLFGAAAGSFIGQAIENDW